MASFPSSDLSAERTASAKKLQATVPQGWCSHPTGSHHCHINPSSSSSHRQPGAAQWRSVPGWWWAWSCVGLTQVRTHDCEFTMAKLQEGSFLLHVLALGPLTHYAHRGNMKSRTSSEQDQARAGGMLRASYPPHFSPPSLLLCWLLCSLLSLCHPSPLYPADTTYSSAELSVSWWQQSQSFTQGSDIYWACVLYHDLCSLFLVDRETQGHFCTGIQWTLSIFFLYPTTLSLFSSPPYSPT